MKIRQMFPLIFALACGVFAGNANAQNTTGYTYYVHGAPGRDLSPMYNPVLPLDVMFNNKCIIQGWTYGQVRGPYSYPAGFYNVKVSPANSAAPCSNAPLFNATLAVYAGQSSFAVAAVSPSKTFAGYLFTADLSPLTIGNARVFVANASAVPSITAGFGPAALDFIAAGSLATAVAPAGTYAGSIYPAGSTTAIYGPVNETVTSLSVTGFFVVGSSATGSLNIIRATIPDVF